MNIFLWLRLVLERKEGSNFCRIEIKLVDSSLLDVTWRIDGQIVQTDKPETLWLAPHALAKGAHEIEVQVADPSPAVRDTRDSLSQKITWTVEVEAP